MVTATVGTVYADRYDQPEIALTGAHGPRAEGQQESLQTEVFSRVKHAINRKVRGGPVLKRTRELSPPSTHLVSVAVACAKGDSALPPGRVSFAFRL
jgi:hypothetical protein